MPVIVGVALGGALGASARYSLDRLIEQRTFSIFPWATFAINISGCFLIGLITASLVDRHHLPAWIRIGMVVGVIGGYTTFSTYAADIRGLVDGGHASTALLYLVLTIAVGLGATVLGLLAGRTVVANRQPTRGAGS